MFSKTRRVLVFTLLVLLGSTMSCLCFAGGKPGGPDPALTRAIQELTIFSELTPSEKEAVQATATLRHGRAAERIIRQGSMLDRMFILLEGAAEIRINDQILVTYAEEPLVGEMEFLEEMPASADVVLVQDADLLELNYAALKALMDEQPRIGYVIMREIAIIQARRLRESNIE